jgi:hypothetical protein
VLAIVGWAVVFALAGCSLGTCAGGSQPFPGVLLDATPWLRTHPGAMIRACLDGMCITDDRALGIDNVPAPPSEAPTSTTRYTLTITSPTTPGLRIKKSVVLHEFQLQTACGPVTWWNTSARLHQGGKISVWKGTGELTAASPSPPPAPATIGP